MPAPHKRQRGEPAISLSSSPSLSAALSSRSGADSAWRAAAAAAGVSGADAFFIDRGRAVVLAVNALPVASETARAQLRLVRVALLAAVNKRCDELEARIKDVESSKAAALQRELCAIDAALSCWKAERDAAAVAVASLFDSSFSAQYAKLAEHFDAAEEQLLSLPTSVVEPPHVGLAVDVHALQSSIAVFGRVVAPHAILASDVKLAATPRHARPGDTVSLRLLLEGSHRSSGCVEELEVSIPAAAAATWVTASLESTCADSLPLSIEVASDIVGQSVIASFVVPLVASSGSSLCVGPVTISGKRVPGAVYVHIPVGRGVYPPLKLPWLGVMSPQSMCVSRSGELFVTDTTAAEIRVFDSDGAALTGIPVEALGLSKKSCCVAFADTNVPTLLIADRNDEASRLVAVDSTTRTVCWATVPGSMQSCDGLATLPQQNVAFSLSKPDGSLSMYNISDGERLVGLGAPHAVVNLTADPASGILFSSVCQADGPCTVTSFSWNRVQGFSALIPVPAAGSGPVGRILAVVPPVTGKRVSHLVVGSLFSGTLRVLDIPALALVHTHELKGMRVVCLAGDPWGEAIAISDYESKAVHILTWPFPGMPALE